MRKRERENPCGICGHYHKYEEGEICGICGHRVPAVSEKTAIQVSAFPSEILPEFLYLGSYDNASRSELLKTQESLVFSTDFSILLLIWPLMIRVIRQWRKKLFQLLKKKEKMGFSLGFLVGIFGVLILSHAA